MARRGGLLAAAAALVALTSAPTAAQVQTCNVTSVQPPGTWFTAAVNGSYRFFNTNRSGPQVLRGISMTGFETGTRDTESGAGYWLFQAPQESAQNSAAIITNIVDVLADQWQVDVVRIPICGSAWLQNYLVEGYGGHVNVLYRDWVDIAICEALSKGLVVLLDVHLWAIADETVKVRNAGILDGCDGIADVPGTQTNGCADKDWFGEYTSARTGKTYNTGDSNTDWQCAIANANGITLDNLMRFDSTTGVQGIEHWLNLWYELAIKYGGASNVWFEVFNEPFQRLSSDFGASCPNGVCPPGVGFGSNLNESQYSWSNWTLAMDQVIGVIRLDANVDNIILLPGLDWSYDYYGSGDNVTGGPIMRPTELLPWYPSQSNIGYTAHPYQHGSCCGNIGSSQDESIQDPYESAFCLYPPTDSSGNPVPSNSGTPIANTQCDDTGYTTTQWKKSPVCVWAPYATNGSGPNPNPGNKCNFLIGEDVGGTTASTSTVSTAQDCCTACLASTTCVGFTFAVANGSCSLKSSVAANPTVNSGLISGVRTSTAQAPAPGLCAGDPETCAGLTEAQCNAIDWSTPAAGGWAKFVLPMQQYGPVIFTELGTFDCSSPYVTTITQWMRKVGVSYTAWALWPQNSGGPGAGACGYPSVMTPTENESDGFGKGTANCVTLSACQQMLQPLGWGATVVAADIKQGKA